MQLVKAKDEPMTVKVGDQVLYGKYSGTEITVDGTDYLIMRESDIYAIYNHKKEIKFNNSKIIKKWQKIFYIMLKAREQLRLGVDALGKCS